MFHRRTTSIVLSVVSFFCASLEVAAAYASIPYGLMRSMPSGAYIDVVTLIDQLFTNLFPIAGQLLLIPLCIALGVVLLLCSGRKANTVHIAIWGSGVAFISIPAVALTISQLFVTYPSRYFFAIFLTCMLAAVPGILCFCVGVVSILFASNLYRQFADGTIVEPPANAKQAEQNTMAEKPAKVKRSVVKKTQLVLERLWLAGLITEKEYDDKLKECADRLRP